jgi:hypothetical protein
VNGPVVFITVNSAPVVVSCTVAPSSVPSASLELVDTAPGLIVCKDQHEVHPCFVVHPVVDDCTDQLRRLGHRERLERVGAGDEVQGEIFWWPAGSS